MAIPISLGSGAASIASEKVGNNDYQQVKVIGGETGSTSVWGINPDRSAQVSIVGIPNVNVSGSVFATISGAGSIIAVPVGSVITVWQNSSILAVPVGSVITTNIGSVITVWQNSSVIAVATGSVVAIPTGNQSISGTVGASVLGNVNTTITSIAASEGFFRVVPPVGATVQGIADLQVVLGASVTAIPAQGTSIFTYITSLQVTNFGSASVLVRLGGGLGSTLGWTIAPAGGGSNVIYPTGLKTGENSAFTASINGTASVLVSAQGFTSKT